GYLLLGYYKKRQNSKQKEKKENLPPPIPFDQAALSALENLRPEEYFEKKQIKEYYFIITEIVREFLSQNYHIDTLEKTSFELIEDLERVERDFNKVRQLDQYLNECDLVKFAKSKPSLAEMKEKRLQSINIIKEFKKPNAF
ncbi:MAG: hypothetical protein KKA31_01225, partial [Candidatus Margulisbacteria bacterium]|nr:hypothetical protein [Candidatus Margulisiibacteriota bacterium]